ncbi:MAG: transcriptional regulator [Actinomycetota bacterium]
MSESDAASLPADGVSVPPPLPSGRRAVLFAVRRLGDALVDDVADALDMTISGARQHLHALADEGLVSVSDVPRAAGERGRPQRAYRITELAEALFPKAYGALTTELLGYLDDEATGAVARLFDRRRDERIAAARRRLGSMSLAERVVELARILDEDGYLATAEQREPGRWRVVEHNCAISDVARTFGQACSSEIEFIRAVLPDADVVRTQHMVAGDHHCAYDIVARER